MEESICGLASPIFYIFGIELLLIVPETLNDNKKEVVKVVPRKRKNISKMFLALAE